MTQTVSNGVIRERISGRYIYWSKVREWAKADGGPTVTREAVAKATAVPAADLEAFEKAQED